jgi:tetratricopeptide (TPR) repeat protein
MKFHPAGFVVAAFALFSFVNGVEMKFEMDSVDGFALPARIMKTVNEVDELNKKGIEALETKNFEAAMDYFNQALKILPEFSDAKNNRGVVKFRKGDIAGARAIWEKLAVEDPGYALASYNLSLVYLHEKNFEQSARLLERAIKTDKQFVEPYVRLGALYLETGERAKGLDQLRKAYKIAPAHPDAWSFYSYALVENGDTAEAISVLKKNGDKCEAQKMLGRLELLRKNWDLASAYLAQAVSKGAEPSLLVDLANAQLEAKNCKGSLQTMKGYFSRSIPFTADAYLIAGYAAKECGDIAASQSYFEQGNRKFPQDGIMRYNLGQVYFYQKQFDQAENAWSGLSDTLQDPSLLYLRAINAKRKNDLSTAEKLAKKALSLDDRAEFHDFLGQILFRKGNPKDAETEFRKAVKLDPNLRSAQLNLAFVTKSADELSGAAQLLEKRFSSCAEDSCTEIALQLSLIYYYQKKTEKAAQTLAAVRENDRDERLYRNLAMFYRELHDWGGAIKALETAVKKYVTDPQTDNELAETYLLAGYYPKAIERFTQLIPKWQQNPWRLYYQLGYAYMEQNDLAKAKECFEKSINSKNNVASRGLLAFLYNREGDVSHARDLWKKNLSDDPSNGTLWINMGLSYERDGKYDEALTYYKKAAEINRDDPQVQINIGNAYTGLGQYADALHAYKQALNSPKKEIAAYNIFLVYAKKRDKEQAEKSLKLLQQEFSSSPNTKRAESEIALWEGDTAKALAVIENLGNKEPGDWISLAQMYAAKGARQKALAFLDKVPNEAQWNAEQTRIKAMLAFQAKNYDEVLNLVRQSGDTSFAAQYNLAVAYYHLKLYTDALTVAERLTRTSSGADRADLCRLAGNAAFCLKQWENARQWYLQLSNVEARNAVVQYNLAVASYNLNDVENSWNYYQKAKELDPTLQNNDIEKRYAAKHGGASKSVSGGATSGLPVADSLYNAAVDLQTAGKDSAAEPLYLQVVEKDPLYNQAWNNLGALYGKRGDIDKAEQAYQKAIEKKHDIPETYANLVNLYIQLEEFVKARQWLIKGTGHNPESDVLKHLKEKIVEAEKKAKK